MPTWAIVAIVVAIAAILWFMFRRKTIKTTTLASFQPIQSAPGVISGNGQAPPAPPPPQQDGVAAPRRQGVSRVAMAMNPAPALQHIPVVGGFAGAVATAGLLAGTGIAHKSVGLVTGIAGGINKGVGDIAGHIPVVGGVAKGVTNVVGSTLGALGSIF